MKQSIFKSYDELPLFLNASFGLSSSTQEPPAQSNATQPPDAELKLIDPPPPIVFQSLLSTLIVNEAP